MVRARCAQRTSRSPLMGCRGRNQFLMPAERIVYMSPVWKRVGLFSKKRQARPTLRWSCRNARMRVTQGLTHSWTQLILTDTPRLLYVDTAKMVLKGALHRLPMRERAVHCRLLTGWGRRGPLVGGHVRGVEEHDGI